jgi:hypothetical protein
MLQLFDGDLLRGRRERVPKLRGGHVLFSNGPIKLRRLCLGPLLRRCSRTLHELRGGDVYYSAIKRHLRVLP